MGTSKATYIQLCVIKRVAHLGKSAAMLGPGPWCHHLYLLRLDLYLALLILQMFPRGVLSLPLSAIRLMITLVLIFYPLVSLYYTCLSVKPRLLWDYRLYL